MNTSVPFDSVDRRQFLKRGVTLGTSLCFGCSYFFSLARAQDPQKEESFESKITENSRMSYEQVFNFAFRDYLAPELIALSRQLGREKLIEMLKNATDETWIHTDLLERLYANLPEQFWSHVLNMQVWDESEKVRVYKITKCLWAKAFREAEAADIGYAMWCYGDYAIARSEKKILERETTLMQGHDYCLLKYTKQT